LSGRKRYWVGLLVGGAFLALFIRTADTSRLVDAFADASYWYVVPAILVYQLSTLFRTMRWQLLLRHLRPIAVTRLYPVLVVGYMANNLLPMRLGELVRSYYLGEREGISKTSALATIIVERLVDALTLILFIAVIALFVPFLLFAERLRDDSSALWLLLVVGVSVAFLIAFGGLVLVAYAPSRARSLAKAVITPSPGAVRRRVLPLVELFIDGLQALRSPRTVGLLFLFSLPIWLLEAGLFFILGYSFGLDEVYEGPLEMAIVMVLVTAIANIGSSVPAAPGGLGLFELVARETLVFLPLAAVDRSVATAYVAVVHAVLLLPMIALGWLFLLGQSVTLRSLWQAGKSTPRQVATPPATEEPGLGRSDLPSGKADSE
jgi:uncharacterized protein (TIRG00374 family)